MTHRNYIFDGYFYPFIFGLGKTGMFWKLLEFPHIQMGSKEDILDNFCVG